jgi:hypothetical protein
VGVRVLWKGDPVDSSNPLVVSVSTPAYGRVAIEASDGRRYEADLSLFSGVYCFPRTEEEWAAVAPDAAGLGLVWTTRFEVHVDQVVALAHRVEEPRRTA